ncbi:MAG: S1 RNA-binding domain-containing protein, partial [Holophagales bacterium]|nr:S1 RNA-binding domain-containing protein [Holophagales bacterium]
NIDVTNQRVSLSIKEFLPNEWDDFVHAHHVGDIVDGKVVNVTDFGLFIDIYDGLEGLAHISEIELAGVKLDDNYRVGDWVSARILRIEEEEKKVGLTMRGVPQPDEAEIAELEARANAKKQGSEPDEDDATDADDETSAADAETSSDDAGGSDDGEVETSDAEASDDSDGSDDGEAEASDDSDGSDDGEAEASDAEASADGDGSDDAEASADGDGSDDGEKSSEKE